MCHTTCDTPADPQATLHTILDACADTTLSIVSQLSADSHALDRLRWSEQLRYAAVLTPQMNHSNHISLNFPSKTLQIRIALDWLRVERSEQLRYAAVLILRQMAANAPAVFNVFVRHFIDVIWAGLRDSKLLVREAATDALRVHTS